MLVSNWHGCRGRVLQRLRGGNDVFFLLIHSVMAGVERARNTFSYCSRAWHLFGAGFTGAFIGTLAAMFAQVCTRHNSPLRCREGEKGED